MTLLRLLSKDDLVLPAYLERVWKGERRSCVEWCTRVMVKRRVKQASKLQVSAGEVT